METKFNIAALQGIELGAISTKSYTLRIVLHSPTECVEKTIIAESDTEAIFDAGEIAEEWRTGDRYFVKAYLITGKDIIKEFNKQVKL